MNNNIRLESGHLTLPKLGKVRIKQHRSIPEDYVLKSVTVSRTPSEKYYVSILYEYEADIPQIIPASVIGLDFSMHNLLVSSEDAIRADEEFLHRYRNSLDSFEAEEPSGFAWELVLGVWQHRTELDAIIEKFAHNWRLDRVGRVELNLLRLGVYEMLYRADVPCKVSMNEALDLDRQYGDARSHTFVNGILDAVAKALEKGELKARG